MPARKRRKTREIVASRSKAITVLSSSLVLRGLREFPHNPKWRVRQAFSETRPFLSISKRGYVAVYNCEGHPQTQDILIHDLELSWLPTVITLPGNSEAADAAAGASLGWSPSGKTLVVASGASPRELYLLDAYSQKFSGRFGKFEIVPDFLCWSGSGKLFAACSHGSEKGSLQLWKAGETLRQFHLIREICAASFEQQPTDEDLGDQGKIWGFGCAAIRPDDKVMAAVLEYDGEWSDDSIVLLRVPSLDSIARIEATGQVTGLTWSRDGQQLLFCASGQAYICDAEASEVTSLPFAAELCCFHPTLPLCAFYNSLLKSSEKGRIFVADSRGRNVIDECAAEGVLDLQWSADGRMLYAVAQDGSAYLYECPQS